MTIPSIGSSLNISAYVNQSVTFQPTLEQFFRYVASGEAAGVLRKQKHPEYRRTFQHWGPVSAQCFPCEIQQVFHQFFYLKNY